MHPSGTDQGGEAGSAARGGSRPFRDHETLSFWINRGVRTTRSLWAARRIHLALAREDAVGHGRPKESRVFRAPRLGVTRMRRQPPHDAVAGAQIAQAACSSAVLAQHDHGVHALVSTSSQRLLVAHVWFL